MFAFKRMRRRARGRLQRRDDRGRAQGRARRRARHRQARAACPAGRSIRSRSPPAGASCSTTGTAPPSICRSAAAPAWPARRSTCRPTPTTPRSKRRAARSRRRSTPRPRRAYEIADGTADGEPVAERLPLTLTALSPADGAGDAAAPPWCSHVASSAARSIAARLPERRGESSIARPPGPLVWLHGASVGEMLADPAAGRAHPRARFHRAGDVGHRDLGRAGRAAAAAGRDPSVRSARHCRTSSRASSITGGPISRCSSNPICGRT